MRCSSWIWPQCLGNAVWVARCGRIGHRSARIALGAATSITNDDLRITVIMRIWISTIVAHWRDESQAGERRGLVIAKRLLAYRRPGRGIYCAVVADDHRARIDACHST